MKRSITILFAFIMFVAASGVAQNVDRKEVAFEYIQLPSKPLNKSIKNYQSAIVLEYEKNVQAMKDNYNASVAKSEDDYVTAYATYLKQKQAAEAKYKKDVATYLAMKNLYPNTPEPVQDSITPPQKIVPVEPRYQKLYNAGELSSSIDLQGYNKIASADAVKITVSLYGFENKPAQLKSKTTTKTVNAQQVSETKYWYEVEYKHTAKVKVESPYEGVLMDENPSYTAQYKLARTNEFASQQELEAWWIMNQNTFLDGLEDKIVQDNLRAINDDVNDRYGFQKRTRYASVMLVRDKKNRYGGAYADFQEAYSNALSGYKNVYESIDKASAKEHLRKSIGAWEKAVAEADYNNKKARVNADIAIFTMMNLIEAYIWMDDYKNSQRYIDKLAAFDLKARHRSYYEDLSNLHRNMKMRYEAYMKQ